MVEPITKLYITLDATEQEKRIVLKINEMLEDLNHINEVITRHSITLGNQTAQIRSILTSQKYHIKEMQARWNK